METTERRSRVPLLVSRILRVRREALQAEAMSGIVLSIDPSIRNTGWAQFRGGEKQGSGVIRTQGTDDFARIRSIVGAVMLLIPSGGCDVVIEVPPAFTYARSARGAKGLNAGSMQKLNWVVGAICTAAALRCSRVHPVSPAEWKGCRSKAWDKAISGKRSSDEADAIGIGEWWLRIGGRVRT